ncbi:MAG: lytic murein transglycosylase B [Desulfobulbaceae bacterium]
MLLLSVLCTSWLLFPATPEAHATAADAIRDGEPVRLDRPEYRKLFTELENSHHFSRRELEKTFAGLTLDREVLELMDRPWEAKPYYQYAPLFLTRKNIEKGRSLLEEHRELLDRIEERFGVDREVILAIWAIETRFGANQGRFNVLRTLNTLFAAYPRRSDFFRKELIQFLLLCRESGIDPSTVKGSYAGAFGQTQFIPSSYRAYAVSFDGDDKPDVWNSVPDVLASIANYLHEHGWTLDMPLYWDLGNELKDPALVAASVKGWRGRVDWRRVRDAQAPDLPPAPGKGRFSIVGLEQPPGSPAPMRYVAGFPNFQAITHWNHSNRYAMAATELAEAIGGRPLGNNIR